MSINFKLVSEFQTIHRRPFAVSGGSDGNILNPTAVRPLVDGEFLTLNSSYAMVRDGDGVETVASTPDNEGTTPSFAYFAEQGRYEVQAIMKGPFLFLAPYEADTLIFTTTLGTSASTLALGSPLSVWDVSIGGIVRRALASRYTGYIVGYVSRMPSTNGNWLRFIHTN